MRRLKLPVVSICVTAVTIYWTSGLESLRAGERSGRSVRVLTGVAESAPARLGLVTLSASPAMDSESDGRAAESGRQCWRSFRHDLALTGVASSTLPARLELLWETTLGDQIVGTAAIVGDAVYVPCLSGELVCLDRRTGVRVWGYRTVDVVDPRSFAPGLKASPAVAADWIGLGDEEGVFHAIDRATGARRWRFATGGEITSSAAIVGGRVLFGSYDNHLYCLDAEAGTLIWKYNTGGRVHGSPAVAEGVAFIAGCDEKLHAIEIASGKQVQELSLDSAVIASPALVQERVYVGTATGDLLALDWRRRERVWRYAAVENEQAYHASPAVTPELVIAGGHDRQVHAVRRATGERAWTFSTRSRIDSSPAVVGDRVFIGSRDGNLYALSLRDGGELWKFNAGRPITAGPAIGEGVLVIGSESRNGKVYCFGNAVQR